MKISIFLILFLFLLTGCSTYYYYPTYQDIPTNTKSGEVRANYFGSGDNQGFNLAYSITNNFGTFVCLNTFDEYNFKHGAQITDFGVYYFKVNSFKAKPNIKLVFSLSGAYGFGQNNQNYELYNLNINRFFLQPSIALTSTFVDFGISGRFSYVDFKMDRHVGQEYDGYFTQIYDVGKEAFYFFEPNLFIGVGYKGIKLNYHFLSVNKLNDSKIEYYSESTPYLSLSMKFDIAKIFKKK